VASTVAKLNVKLRKLLDLYYTDKIDGDRYAEEERRLTGQIATLEAEEVTKGTRG